jgi:glycosyltransferase involved in cell wall biosynthesis
MTNNGISIILPSYNEAVALPQLAGSILEIFRNRLPGYDYEIVIIDDNSTDGTAEAIRVGFGSEEKVRLIVRTDERGLASAVLRGIQEAKMEYVVVMDSDFNHPPEKIVDLVKKIPDYDLICYSRYVKGGGMNTDNWFFRYWGSRIYNKFLQLYLGLPTNDNLSGFFIARKKDIQKLPTGTIFNGYGEFYFGVLYFMNKICHSFRLLQLPVIYERRKGGESKTKFSPLMIKYFKRAREFKSYKICKKKVLVTYARNRIAYVSAKSLSRAGYEVHTGDCVRFAMAFFSCYVKKNFFYSSPFRHEEAFIEDLLRYIKKNRIDILLPSHEEGFIIAKHERRFEGIVKLLTPSYEQIELANNKIRSMEWADGLRIPYPLFQSFGSSEEFERFLEGEGKIKFPVVIKLQKSRGSAGLCYAKNKTELKEKFDVVVREFGIKEDFPIIQEYIEGYGLGVSMLYKDGKALASFTHKRLIELPLTGGTSVERISVHHLKAEEFAKSLLDSLKWNGVAMVEFKVDEKTGEPYFLEINPRFWGSLNQAVVSGVDFPLLACKTLEGEDFLFPEYKTGIRTRWFWGGVFVLPSYILHGKFKEVGVLLKIFKKNLFFDDFSWSDPLPFLINPIIPLINLMVRGKITFEKKEEEVKNFNT